MTVPRTRGTLALTVDGGDLAQASAELYHPSSGRWTATAIMDAARRMHTATLLLDGTVLVAGGDGDNGASASVRLYRPATATLLPEGKVLVAGGDQDGSPDGPFAEVYDPISGTWTAAGTMITPRSGHTATLLPDGTVLVAGGFIHGSRELCGPASGSTFDCLNPLASAELYDPQTGAWSAGHRMIAARGGHTATLLEDGSVLVAGGSGSAEESACQCHAPLGSAELYDPSSGTWSATASMVAVRNGHTATLLPDGRVLAASGYGVDIAIGLGMLASAELYDPGSGN
jgi:hypothetical protein